MEEAKEGAASDTTSVVELSSLDRLISGERINAAEDPLRRWKWFAGANMAIVAVFLMLTQGAGGALLPIVLACSVIGPFISLALSKPLIRMSHNLRMLSPDSPMSEDDQRIYRIVQTLAQRAGLEETPEIGIYDSPDMNAFATGATRSSALVAFSTGLIENMDDHEIAAVAAHEVAHIANGDMVSMTLIQSAVNVIVMLVSIPFWFYRLLVTDSRAAAFCVEAARFVVRGIILIGGYLVSMAFSRRREFAADAFAAKLTSAEAMASALNRLAQDNAVAPSEQGEYACLKISSPMSFAEFLSSHPPIEKRVAALRLSTASVPSVAPATTAAPPPIPIWQDLTVTEAHSSGGADGPAGPPPLPVAVGKPQ